MRETIAEHGTERIAGLGFEPRTSWIWTRQATELLYPAMCWYVFEYFPRDQLRFISVSSRSGMTIPNICQNIIDHREQTLVVLSLVAGAPVTNLQLTYHSSATENRTPTFGMKTRRFNHLTMTPYRKWQTWTAPQVPKTRVLPITPHFL